MKDGVAQVIELLRTGTLFPKYEGLINRRDHDDFILLDYSNECQYDRHWDAVTSVCRGLIIDSRDWSVAARPFPKFFNLGEEPESRLENLPKTSFLVTEKMDGSLGIAYRDRQGRLTLSTRGSFASEQAARGTEMLRSAKNLGEISPEWTLLFEIVYRENKTAIRYDFDGLVLLAIVNRHTGEEYPWSMVANVAHLIGVRIPRTWSLFSTVEEAHASAKGLPHNMEGYVLKFGNGFRVKLKGDAYLAIHRIVWDLNEKRVLEHLIAGTFEQTLMCLPEELRPEFEALSKAYINKAESLEMETEAAFRAAPKSTKKELALWARSNVRPPVMHAMFTMFNGQKPNWFELSTFVS